MAKIKKAQPGASVTKKVAPPGKKSISSNDLSRVVTDRMLLNKYIPSESARLKGPRYGTQSQTDSLRRKAIKEGDFTEDKSGFLRPTEKYMKPKRVSPGMKKGGKIKKSK